MGHPLSASTNHRTCTRFLRHKHIPLKYAEKEAESKRAFIEEWKAWGGGKVNTNRDTVGCVHAGFEQRRLHCQFSLLQRLREACISASLDVLEAKRREAQNFYREEQKYIREHKGEFNALIKADRQAQANALSGPLSARVAATLGGGPPLPPTPGDGKNDAD
ncbi:hypothetical protein EDB86DRAFT_1849651 [Lactarius hatsudake]|nr:hypothetical protein EDB86DRAFT_1849651 [Lactarius hatsudake]